MNLKVNVEEHQVEKDQDGGHGEEHLKQGRRRSFV